MGVALLYHRILEVMLNESSVHLGNVYFLNCQHKCLMLILNSFGLLLFLLVSTVCFLVMILADVSCGIPRELLYYIHSW